MTYLSLNSFAFSTFFLACYLRVMLMYIPLYPFCYELVT
jgi:hypothetical protein